jgi:hypothetical protein
VHRWWPSQRTRQERGDHPGTRGERLGVLDAWSGEVWPCMRGLFGLATKPSEEGFSVWVSEASPKARRDGDEIWVRRKASRRVTRSVIVGLASK